LEFKGGEIKDVSDITKGRTTTHIEVENHSVPKSLDDRAMNSVHNFDIYIVSPGRDAKSVPERDT
jgi:hypothetical protein